MNLARNLIKGVNELKQMMLTLLVKNRDIPSVIPSMEIPGIYL